MPVPPKITITDFDTETVTTVMLRWIFEQTQGGKTYQTKGIADIEPFSKFAAPTDQEIQDITELAEKNLKTKPNEAIINPLKRLIQRGKAHNVPDRVISLINNDEPAISRIYADALARVEKGKNPPASGEDAEAVAFFMREMQKYVELMREEYAEKKRGMIYDIHQSLREIGIIKRKTQTSTTNATFSLTSLGRKMLHAFLAAEILEQKGINILELAQQQ